MIHRPLLSGNAVNTGRPIGNGLLFADCWEVKAMVNGMGAAAVGPDRFITAGHVINRKGEQVIDYNGVRYRSSRVYEHFDSACVVIDRPHGGPFIPAGRIRFGVPLIFSICFGRGRGKALVHMGSDEIIGWERDDQLRIRWGLGRIFDAKGPSFYTRFEGDPAGDEGFAVVSGDSGSPIWQLQDGRPVLIGVWASGQNPDAPRFGDINTANECFTCYEESYRGDAQPGPIPPPIVKPQIPPPEPAPTPPPIIERPTILTRLIVEVSADGGKTWDRKLIG